MGPHVCAKIRRLAEQFVTYTALVGLRPIVNGTPVLLQATLKLELCRAVRTEISVFIVVYLAHMTSQHGRQFELFSTLGACKRSFVGMFEDDVPPQQAGPLETDSALTAHVRSKIKVNFLVRIPRTGLSEGFATDTARIWPLPCMTSHVLRKCSCKRTSTSTDAADKWLIFTAVMLTHVLLEEFHLAVLLIAPGARMPIRPMGRVLVMS